MKHWLVGGSVRNRFIREIHGYSLEEVPDSDVDYVVEGATCFEDLIDYIKFIGFLPISNSGTESGFVEFSHTLSAKAKSPIDGSIVDFALTRREFDYVDRRHPAKCEIGSLAEDLARRDFTFNSLVVDPKTNHLVFDLFGGIDDIRNGVVRCVGNPLERFAENPERMIRALDFCCRYGFFLHNDTLQAFHNEHLIQLIANEVDDCKVKALNKILKNKASYSFFFEQLYQDLPIEFSWALFSNIGLMATNKKEFV